MSYDLFLFRLIGPATLNCAVVPLFLLCAAGLGQLLLRFCAGKTVRHGGLLVQTALGVVLFAVAGLAAGGALSRLPDWAVFAGLTAGAGWALLQFYRTGYLAGARRWIGCNRTAAILLAAGGLFLFGSALFPPYNWDEMTYQLALPVGWLAQHSIAPTLDNPYSFFPLLPQFVLLWIIHTGGLGAAKVLILVLYLLIDLALYDEIRRRIGRGGAIILTLVFALSPLLGVMVRSFYVEPFIVLMLLAALRLRRMRLRQPRIAIAYALLASGAAAVKLTAAAVAVVIVLCGWQSGRGARNMWWLCLIPTGIVATGLFYLRPFLACGNPFYPFGNAWFGGSQAVEAFHQAMGRYYYGLEGAVGICFSWFFAGWNGQIYDGITLGFAWIILVILGTVGTLILRSSELRFWGGMTLGCYLFWAVTSQQTRFLLPIFALALVWGAAVLAELPARGRKICLGMLLVAALASMDGTAWKHNFYSWKFLAKARKNPAAMLGHGMRDREYMAMMAQVAKLPPDATVLLLFDRRTLYLPRRGRIGTPEFQEWIFAPELPAGVNEMEQQLDAGKIDYILVGASRRNPDHLSQYNEINAKLAYRLEVMLKLKLLQVIPTPDTGDYTLIARRRR